MDTTVEESPEYKLIKEKLKQYRHILIVGEAIENRLKHLNLLTSLRCETYMDIDIMSKYREQLKVFFKQSDVKSVAEARIKYKILSEIYLKYEYRSLIKSSL